MFDFKPEVDGFSRVEYLSVFVALMYAFAIAEFFIGWAGLMKNREVIKIDWRLSLWSFLLFWALIINWYMNWIRVEYLKEGFGHFILLFLPFVIFFFIPIFLIPDPKKNPDMGEFYEKNINWILILTSIFLIISVSISIIYNEFPFFSFPILIRFVFPVLALVAIITKKEWIRLVLLGYLGIAMIRATIMLL